MFETTNQVLCYCICKHVYYNVRPPFDSVQLVQITPISLAFMVFITIVTGAYNPTNIIFTILINTINHSYLTYKPTIVINHSNIPQKKN